MLRGNWDKDTTYNEKDVVKYTDNVVYNLLHPCPAGTPPTDTRYWGRASAMRAMCALMIIDMMTAEDEYDQAIIDRIPANISEDTIILKSSTEGSEKEFAITVDDEGELTATDLTETTSVESET